MEWKIIPDSPDYEVSESGEIRKISTKILVHQRIDSKGYPSVKIKISDGKFEPVRVHSLVYVSFVRYHKNVTGRVVHKDGIRINNHRSNLKLKKYKKQPLSVCEAKLNKKSNRQLTMEPKMPNDSFYDSKEPQDIVIKSSGDVRISKTIFDRIPRSEIGKILVAFLDDIFKKIERYESTDSVFIIDEFDLSGALKELIDILVKKQNKRKPYIFTDDEKTRIKNLIKDVMSNSNIYQM